ncbi:MAG: hypothetical protein JSS81_27885 [Acidobacteria bacterium]|nr:hypothetical protein [Acidobacteriota bacterium]
MIVNIKKLRILFLIIGFAIIYQMIIRGGRKAKFGVLTQMRQGAKTQRFAGRVFVDADVSVSAQNYRRRKTGRNLFAPPRLRVFALK